MSISRARSSRPTEAIAGFLATVALFLGALQLFYRPFRMAPVAVVLVCVAAAMSREQQRLVMVAVYVITICFVVGAALTVWTGHPLY